MSGAGRRAYVEPSTVLLGSAGAGYVPETLQYVTAAVAYTDTNASTAITYAPPPELAYVVTAPPPPPASPPTAVPLFSKEESAAPPMAPLSPPSSPDQQLQAS